MLAGHPLLPGPRQAGGPPETLEGCGTPGAASLLSSVQSTAMGAPWVAGRGASCRLDPVWIRLCVYLDSLSFHFCRDRTRT